MLTQDSIEQQLIDAVLDNVEDSGYQFDNNKALIAVHSLLAHRRYSLDDVMRLTKKRMDGILHITDPSSVVYKTSLGIKDYAQSVKYKVIRELQTLKKVLDYNEGDKKST